MAALSINLTQIGTSLASMAALANASGARANAAYPIYAGLRDALASYTALTAAFSTTWTYWLATYFGAAIELDRASRLAVIQIIQTNTSVTPIVQAAFAVAPLGTPAPIVVDSTTATHDAINARFLAAAILSGQLGATCVSPSETPAGISAWLAAASYGFAYAWTNKPGDTDPTQTSPFLTATSTLFFANAAAASYLGATGFV